MNEVTNWTFGENEVRTIELDGVPWWVLSDVCEEIDTETVKDHEWCVRMINLRFSLKMLNEWFDTDVINDALCYTTQEEYWKYRDEKNRLRSEFEAALKKSLDIPEDNSFALSQSVAEFFTVVTMHKRK